MAKPGYGKRNAPDQLPPRPGDFAHLPAREAYIAGLLDQLGENAAMDAKTIAKAQPLYGQQAVRTVLNELAGAGHLRRVRRRVEPRGEGGTATGTRWVFQTYWSRTARDNEWWARFLDGDASAAQSATPAQASTSDAAPGDVTPQPDSSAQPHENTRPSTAYTAL
ncbi:hypothetical protein ACWD35_32525, partial [Streptomyces sp. NPDC002671]